mgnify:CR=1 FL=1
MRPRTGRGLAQSLGQGLGTGQVDDVDAETAAQRGEVGCFQLHAPLGVAHPLLVVTEHPVAGVVNHQHGHRKVFLRQGRELADGEQHPVLDRKSVV